MRRELRKARRIAKKAAREIRRVERRYGIDPQAEMPEPLRLNQPRRIVVRGGDIVRWADNGEPVDITKINDDTPITVLWP